MGQIDSSPVSAMLIRLETEKSKEIDVALNAMACICQDADVVYVAVPITGGPRFVEWYSTRGANLNRQSSEYWDALRCEVIEPNCAAARHKIEHLIKQNVGAIIDPSRLNVPEWTQSDYRHFWSRVIERLADRTVFLDGWYLSNGCIFEFFVVSRLGLPIYNSEMHAIPYATGLELIDAGIAEYKRIGADVEFVTSVLEELRKRNS